MNQQWLSALTDRKLALISDISWRTMQVTARIPVEDHPQGVSATAESGWVTNLGSGSVSRIDPSSDRVEATIGVIGVSPQGIVATADAVWVTNCGDDTASRIDPDTNQAVATVNVGTRPAGITSTDSVWVTNCGDDTVSRIS